MRPRAPTLLALLACAALGGCLFTGPSFDDYHAADGAGGCAGAGGCPTPCDLVSPAAACGPARGCVLVSADGPETDCAAVGTATGPGTCSAADPLACAPSYVCVAPGDCARWCRMTHPEDCPALLACIGFASPVKIGQDELGACE